MQSDDNQPRQYDESSQAEHTNGLYISSYMCEIFIVLYSDFMQCLEVNTAVYLLVKVSYRLTVCTCSYYC